MHVKNVTEVALGIVTSIGGFLEAGSIATSAQAGALFRMHLIWAIVLGTACLIVLVEMSGRLAAISQHTIPDAIRERFGFTFFVVTLGGVAVVSLLVLAAEIGGACLAIQLVTGIGFPWWAIPVAFAAWLVLWKGSFGVLEKGVSLLGLVTVAFVVGAVRLHPPLGEIARGVVPTLPHADTARYWFGAVSILGASLTPYLFYFYSSGAIEDGWTEKELRTNRAVATVGMTFGGVLAIAVLVVAALVFGPAGTRLDSYERIATMLTPAFSRAGLFLFAASLGVACFGAAMEIALALAYLVAQGLGFTWGKNLEPCRAARFTLAYTVTIALATIVVVVGIDPLTLTNVSMALTAATLPLAVVPFLIVMNDRHYMREHTNGWAGNAVVAFTIVLACVLAIVSLPLEIMGG